MKITDLLNKNGIALNASPSTKFEAIDILVDLMDATGNISNKDDYKKDVLSREKSSTTGIGEGIAIPHAKSSAVKTAGLVAAVVKDGVNFESLDGQHVYLIFLIAAPNTEADVHVEVLSRLATLLMDSKFRKALINAPSTDEFLALIDKMESGRYEKYQQRLQR